MWSQNKMQNSITIWLTIHRHSWISFSCNICVLPSIFDHMSFWRCSGDNIANDALLHIIYSSLAHQLPDSLLEILATVQLKWLRTPPWHHISCLDYTTWQRNVYLLQRHWSSRWYNETWLDHIIKVSHCQSLLFIHLLSLFWNPWQNLQSFPFW
jgi:hypothetical protein